MFFMVKFSWEPENRNEVIERRTKEEIPEGVKIVGEWVSVAGATVFRMIETDSPEAMGGLTVTWSDIGKQEIIPVMKTEDMLKLTQ